MARRDEPLLDQIERGALDHASDLPGVLRLCIALGGRSGSRDLREWATTELKGYSTPSDVPGYRVVQTPLLADFQSGPMLMKGQQISTSLLPDWARDAVGEEVRLTSCVGEIAALARGAADGQEARFGPFGGPDLVAYMNQNTIKWPQQIHRIYYHLNAASLEGVVDAVRTTLVELVAEMRAGLPTATSQPSAALADQAVHVAVHGKGNRVHITAASNAPAVSSALTDSPGAQQVVTGQRARTIAGAAGEHPLVTVILVLAAVVAAVAAVLALL